MPFFFVFMHLETELFKRKSTIFDVKRLSSR